MSIYYPIVEQSIGGAISSSMLCYAGQEFENEKLAYDYLSRAYPSLLRVFPSDNYKKPVADFSWYHVKTKEVPIAEDVPSEVKEM